MANIIERDIFVLRDASSVAQPIEYVQGTNAVPILLHIRDYDIPTDSTARVYVEWPSTKGEYDESGVTIDGNDIRIEPKNTLFSEVGKSKLQVCIVNGEDTLVTFSYPVMAKKNHVPGITTPSENHSDFLDEYISNMKSATNSANGASEQAIQSANEANAALDAFKGALEGTVINDETPSEVTTYSSKRIELFDIQESTDTTLPNSKKGGYRLLELDGNTEQKTLSGKNLFNPATKSDDTMLTWVNGVTMVETGTVVSDYIPLNSITEIYSNYVFIPFFYNSAYSYLGCSVELLTHGAVSVSSSIVIPTNGNIAYCRIVFRASNNESVNMTTVDDIVISTTEDVAFEEYCGGQPSPNPYYPQVIENTFDVVEMIQGYWNTSSGVLVSSSVQICCKNPIPCSPNDAIAIVLEKAWNVQVMYYNEKDFLSAKESGANTSHTFSVPSEATHFTFNVLHSTNYAFLDTVGKITLTVNGKYVGCVKGHGKNFWKYGDVSDTTAVAIHCLIPSGTYTLSAVVSSSDTDKTINRIIWHYVDGTSGYTNMARGTTRTKQKVIFTNDVVQMDFYASQNNSSSIDDTFTFTNIQLELGEVMTDYEPYKETSAYFLTNEPPRLGDVLYKDSDGLFKVERNRKEITYASTDIVKSNSYDNIQYFGLVKPTDSMSYGLYKYEELIADKYLYDMYVNHGSTYNTSGLIGKIITTGSNVQYWIGFPPETTLEEVQAYGDVTVVYWLKTPTIEVLDTDSQIALNSLETFDTVTYIEVDSRVQPSGIKGQYGTSQVGAYTLKALNNTESNAVRLEDAINTMLLLT